MRRRNVAIAWCALSTQSHQFNLLRYRQHKVIAISPPTTQLIVECLLFLITSASILRTHHG